MQESSCSRIEKIEADFKKISPLALPQYLLECEFYDMKNAQDVLDDAIKEFSSKGGAGIMLAKTVLTSTANSVFLALLRHFHEPTYKQLVKTKTTDIAGYIDNAINFEYPASPASHDAMVAEKELQQDMLRRDMVAHPGKPVPKEDGTQEWEPSLDVNNYDKGKNYRDKTNLDKKDENGTPVQFNESYKYRQSKDEKTITDCNGKTLYLNQNDASDRSQVAEADHVIPLAQIDASYKFSMQRYLDLDKKDKHGRTILQQITNSDENMQILPGDKNAAKGGAKTNLEYIKYCEDIKSASGIYEKLENKDLTKQEKKELQSKLSVMKLTKAQKSAARLMSKKDKTEEEKKELQKYEITEKEKKQLKEKHKEAEAHIRNELLKEGSKSVICEQMGKIVGLIIGPIGFEIRDSFKNGICHGFEDNCNEIEALLKRIGRALEYTFWGLGKIFIGFISDMSKMLSMFLAEASKILTNIFGKFLNIALSGISVIIEAVKVLITPGMTLAQKGDAISKIIVSFIGGILGAYVIDLGLKALGLPDPFSDIASAVFAGVISALVMHFFDKLDIFGIKRELRNQRIKEIFDLRCKQLDEDACQFNIAVTEKLKQQRLQYEKLRDSLSQNLKNQEFISLNENLDHFAKYFQVELPYSNTADFINFVRENKKIVIA